MSAAAVNKGSENVPGLFSTPESRVKSFGVNNASVDAEGSCDKGGMFGSESLNIGLNSSGDAMDYDWSVAEALAVSFSPEIFGGTNTGKFLFDYHSKHFPSDICRLLDLFETQSNSSLALETVDGDGRSAFKEFIFTVSERFKIARTSAALLVNRFIRDIQAERLGQLEKKRRVREVLKQVNSLTLDESRRGLLRSALDNVQSSGEIDSIECVMGMAHYSNDKFAIALENAITLTRKTSDEIIFGLKASQELLRRVESYFLNSKIEILNTALLMIRCAADVDMQHGVAPEWYKFCTDFVSKHADTLEDRIFGTLQQNLSDREAEITLLCLFFLPTSDNIRLLKRMTAVCRKSNPDQVGYTYSVPWVARIMFLLDQESIRISSTDISNSIVSLVNYPVLQLTWSTYIHDRELFDNSYQEGFSYLMRKLSKDTRCAFVLEGFLSKAVTQWDLDKFLVDASDCEVFAELCSAAFRGKAKSCMNFWRSTRHPLRRLLDCVSSFEKSASRFCGGLVSSKESAKYALEFLDYRICLDGLELLRNLSDNLDTRFLRELFDPITVVSDLLPLIGTKEMSVSTLLSVAKHFSQELLSAIVEAPPNHSEKQSFLLLERMKQSAELSSIQGDYSQELIPELEILAIALTQIGRENASSELQAAFPNFREREIRISKKDFEDGLAALGYRGGVDEQVFSFICSSKMDLDDLLTSESNAFFRVLLSTLQSRREKSKQFIIQAMKLVSEIFINHRTWHYSQIEQRYRIAILTTRMLRLCTSKCFKSVLDQVTENHEIWKELQTHFASPNRFERLTVHKPYEQELVEESLLFISSVLKIEPCQVLSAKILCQPTTIVGIASYLDRGEEFFPEFSSVPLHILAAGVIQGILVSSNLARHQKVNANAKSARMRSICLSPSMAGTSDSDSEGFIAPSIVGGLSQCIFLEKSLSTLASDGEVCAISLLIAILEIEPDFASNLISHGDILPSVFGIICDHAKFDTNSRLYCEAVFFFLALWSNSYSAITMRLLTLFPDFWAEVSFSLFQDVSPIADIPTKIENGCFKLLGRAHALRILTIELDRTRYNNVDESFRSVLLKLSYGLRDRAWTQQYLKADFFVPDIESISKNLNWNSFLSGSGEHFFSTKIPTRESSFGFRCSAYGSSFIYDMEQLSVTFPDSPEFLSKTREYNLALSQFDAELDLLRSWRDFIETRCLIRSIEHVALDRNTVDESRTSTRLEGAMERLVLGDMTPYELVSSLAKFLKDLNYSRLMSALSGTVLLEVSEMLANILHSEVFVLDPIRHLTPDSSATTFFDNLLPRTPALSSFDSAEGFIFEDSSRKWMGCHQSWRPRRETDDHQGFVEVENVTDLVDIIVSIFASLSIVFDLQTSRRESGKSEDIRQLMVSLLTSISIVFQVVHCREIEDTDAIQLDEIRVKVLHLTMQIFVFNEPFLDLMDICVPLFTMLLSRVENRKNCLSTPCLEAFVDVLCRKFAEFSRGVSSEYTQQLQLIWWFEQNKLCDIRVKVPRGRFPSFFSSDQAVRETDKVTETGLKDGRRNEIFYSDRLRQLSKKLGYGVFDAEQADSSFRKSDRLESSSLSDDGSIEINLVRLMFCNGITSLANLRSLDNVSLQRMGISSLVNRPRLNDLMKAIENEKQRKSYDSLPLRSTDCENRRKLRKKSASLFNTENEAHFSEDLARLVSVLRVLTSVVQTDMKSVANFLVRSNIFNTLITNSLLSSVSGDKPLSPLIDNRDNASTICFRGYTIMGERDIAHVVWCQAVRFFAIALECTLSAYTSEILNHTLDFLTAHVGSILSVLSGYQYSDRVFTIGGLEETNALCMLLRVLSKHSEQWRLRQGLHVSLLNASCNLFHSLISGVDSTRRYKFLEEFAISMYSNQRVVPRLCLETRCVTVLENVLSRARLSEHWLPDRSLRPERKSSLSLSQNIINPHTPYHLPSHASGTSLNHKHRSSSLISLGSPTLSPRVGTTSSAVDSDISRVHLYVEHSICKVLQNLFGLIRNPSVLSLPGQLEIDANGGGPLPRHHWIEAVRIFPLSFSSLKGQSVSAAQSIDTLISLLVYVKRRLHLCAEDTSNKRGYQALESPEYCGSMAWKNMLQYLATNCLYVFTVSLELEVHEFQRLKALKQKEGPNSRTFRSMLEHSSKYSDDFKKVALQAIEECESYLVRLDLCDHDFVKVVKKRILKSISFLQVCTVPKLDSAQALPVMLSPTEGKDDTDESVQEKPSPRVCTQLNEIKVSEPAAGVLIWLHGHSSNDREKWEAVFRDFDVAGLNIILPQIEDFSLVQSSEDEIFNEHCAGRNESVLHRFRDGNPVSSSTSLVSRIPQSKLNELEYQTNARQVVQRLLDECLKTVNRIHQGYKGKLMKESLVGIQELFALISVRNEDVSRIIKIAQTIRELVLRRVAFLGDPARVFLGGFQEGGCIALFVALMLALDENEPIVIGGSFSINSYLPLSQTFINAFIEKVHGSRKSKNPLPKFPDIVLRSGRNDNVVDKAWAEIVARTLHSLGLNVNFDLCQGLGHEQWDLNQLSQLRSFLKSKCEAM